MSARRLPGRLRLLAGCRRGVSAVEFALLAPVFALILAATVDVGMLIHLRMQLNSALAAGSNYALVNGEALDADTVDQLGQRLTSVLTGGMASSAMMTHVRINNGATFDYSAGRIVKSGTAATASQCFCPTGSGGAIAWNGPFACGAACADGSVSGKFVELDIGRDYTPIFGGFGIVRDGHVAVSTFLQAD